MRRSREANELIFLLCAVVCVWVAFAVLTGIGPMAGNPYHSYSLQAEAWLQGRLDLGQNYEYLELAIFEGKYFVSFPPFPSILLLPFAALFGADTPDHLICALALMAGAVLAYKTAKRLGWEGRRAVFASLFLTVGSNLVFVGFCGWVWFLAQTLAFAFTMASFYCAMNGGRRGILCSLLFLCCAAGCRPFQLAYLPVVAYLIWKREKISVFGLIKRYWYCALPAVALGCVYMALNYARFGSVFEFGHNYLPEFTASEYGQFSLHYLPQNLWRLFRLPPMEGGRLLLPQFDGFLFLLASPIFASVLLAAFAKNKRDGRLAALAGALVAAHLLFLCLHKTMGGWQFGNRYTIDALPAAYLIYLVCRDKPGRGDGVLFLLGLSLNLAGSILTFLS